MPTPFYHMSVAEELRRSPELVDEVRYLLGKGWGAFLLGNTAPDVHVTSGQSRQATHFFTLPLERENPPPWDLLFVEYPSLLPNNHLRRDQKAFLAGYLCHLQADWLWVADIFITTFGPQCTWSDFNQRLYLHNALRAYLDQRVLPHLSSDTSKILGHTKPDHWIPFIEDLHLIAWRDYLSEQLAPEGIARTVEVFAIRQGIPIEHFHRLISSETQMEQEIFVHLPKWRLKKYHKKLMSMNIKLLNGIFYAGN
jgi:hypothetical protein